MAFFTHFFVSSVLKMIEFGLQKIWEEIISIKAMWNCVVRCQGFLSTVYCVLFSKKRDFSKPNYKNQVVSVWKWYVLGCWGAGMVVSLFLESVHFCKERELSTDQLFLNFFSYYSPVWRGLWLGEIWKSWTKPVSFLGSLIQRSFFEGQARKWRFQQNWPTLDNILFPVKWWLQYS